jgi:ABC-type amino acid transport substrate-binding protein
LTLIAQALEAGKIDAAVLSPAQSSSLKAKGFSVLLDLYAANVYVLKMLSLLVDPTLSKIRTW